MECLMRQLVWGGYPGPRTLLWDRAAAELRS